jgi:hypothetical protein
VYLWDVTWNPLFELYYICGDWGNIAVVRGMGMNALLGDIVCVVFSMLNVFVMDTEYAISQQHFTTRLRFRSLRSSQCVQ